MNGVLSLLRDPALVVTQRGINGKPKPRQKEEGRRMNGDRENVTG
jgi:hypothetical protein